MNDLLKALRESTEFHQIMDEMWGHRPVIPDYAPQATIDQTENLIERVKFQTAMRKGFDDLYRKLVGSLKE